MCAARQKITKRNTRVVASLIQANAPSSLLALSTITYRKKTANDIDESQDGVIKRMEWMRYTAVLDEGSGKSIGVPTCLQTGTVDFSPWRQ